MGEAHEINNTQSITIDGCLPKEYIADQQRPQSDQKMGVLIQYYFPPSPLQSERKGLVRVDQAAFSAMFL